MLCVDQTTSMYTYTYVHKHAQISVTLEALDDEKAFELLLETVTNPRYYYLSGKLDEHGNEIDIRETDNEIL
jgi:hypothetical protein